ncbi:MAG: hypothetical protein IJS39_08325 [Synergistaceae bacterium]|nr:hypothetical protein [Synergistaceae bacterium]
MTLSSSPSTNVQNRQVVYVSCNPATLARNCRILAAWGYGLESLRAFDMFPQTAHVESVAVLKK